MEKALYRRLIKRFHPDVTTCPRRKRIFEELSKRINHAYEIGDYDQLLAIERAGENFLKPRKEKPAEREKCVSEENQEFLKSAGRRTPRQKASKPARPAFPFWRIREAVRTFIYYVVNPYGLAHAMNSWNENGRIRNLLGIVGGIAWFQVTVVLWHQLGTFSAWTQLHGVPHESLGGLGIVLAKGLLILAAIPIVIPLAILAFYTGIAFFLCALLCAFSMNILGLFYPYLEWLPLVIISGVFARVIWAALAEDLTQDFDPS